MNSSDKIYGCLLGGAVGDALGLPAEKLTPQRQRSIFGPITEMHFLPGRGMVSDDTEHAIFTARALLESNGDAAKFRRLLHSEFRRWMLALPPGIGLATLRSGLKSLLFLPNPGVFSAGNGPAMRASIIGVCFGDRPEQLHQYLDVSTRMTHTDPKAHWGAVVVALAATSAGSREGRELVHAFEAWSDQSEAANECLGWLKKAVNSASRGQSTSEFCLENAMQKGVGGYILHTVPVVIQCFLRNKSDFRSGVEEIVACGGDSDTTAAILGGLLGAQLGAAAIPKDWGESLWDWPNSRKSIEDLAGNLGDALSGKEVEVKPRLILPFQLMRNVFFVLIVLGHAVRRMIPPYG